MGHRIVQIIWGWKNLRYANVLNFKTSIIFTRSFWRKCGIRFKNNLKKSLYFFEPCTDENVNIIRTVRARNMWLADLDRAGNKEWNRRIISKRAYLWISSSCKVGIACYSTIFQLTQWKVDGEFRGENFTINKKLCRVKE